MEELFSRSDYLSLHTPLTPETEHIVNAQTLKKMKKGVRIVNCARGELVDEGALAEAVRSGHVAGAALDVFAVEPPKNSPLAGLPQVLMTPHIAGSTAEAQEISSATARRAGARLPEAGRHRKCRQHARYPGGGVSLPAAVSGPRRTAGPVPGADRLRAAVSVEIRYSASWRR
jgi:phosphoglycerate dehydrogenase-like enzyme